MAEKRNHTAASATAASAATAAANRPSRVQHASSSLQNVPSRSHSDPPFVLMNEIARRCHASADALIGLVSVTHGREKITRVDSGSQPALSSAPRLFIQPK